MTLILIILLICLVIYFYYQRRKLAFSPDGSSPDFTVDNQTELNQALMAFLRDQLNSHSLTELKSKLNEKTLDELIEENEDYETEIDNLTRTKNSLEADLLAQSNAFQARIKEKDREVKKLKEELTEAKKAQEKLTSEKQQHKGSLERIKLLTEQITNLEKERQSLTETLNKVEKEKASLAEQLKKMPGEFPQEPKESSPELEKFIIWAQEHEEFTKVDWDYYRTQEDWEKSFRKWNSLRADRISLLEEWKESQND